MREIGVWIRFVLQSEVPPLFHKRLETMTHHRLAENHAVAELHSVDFATFRRHVVRELTRVFTCLGIAAPVGMALLAKPVKSTAHIDLFLRRHVEKCQINSASSAMARLFSDVALREQDGFVQIRIEIGFHPNVIRILRPVHEMSDGFLRTVGIEYLQTVALLLHIIAHCFQCLGCLNRKQRRRLLIAVDTITDEIVSGIVADFENRVRHGFGKMHKA